jgi:hypothetical protein
MIVATAHAGVQMHPRVSAPAIVAAQNRNATASCRSTACGHIEHASTSEAFNSDGEDGDGEADVEAFIA